MNVWLEVIGWVGSGLVVWSLMQARVLRFRWMNLAGSAVAAGYNAWVGIWPFAVMNGVIAIIDVYWLLRLYREADDAETYQVVEVRPDDSYLHHVLGVHTKDVATFHPAFDLGDLEGAGSVGESEGRQAPGARSAFLVLRRDETVGAVIVRDLGDATATVELDWVSPRFRDFNPGRFVHNASGIFAAKGFDRVVWDDPAAGARDYLSTVGFAPETGGDPGVGAGADGSGQRASGVERWVRLVA